MLTRSEAGQLSLEISATFWTGAASVSATPLWQVLRAGPASARKWNRVLTPESGVALTPATALHISSPARRPGVPPLQIPLHLPHPVMHRVAGLLHRVLRFIHRP